MWRKQTNSKFHAACRQAQSVPSPFVRQELRRIQTVRVTGWWYRLYATPLEKKHCVGPSIRSHPCNRLKTPPKPTSCALTCHQWYRDNHTKTQIYITLLVRYTAVTLRPLLTKLPNAAVTLVHPHRQPAKAAIPLGTVFFMVV